MTIELINDYATQIYFTLHFDMICDAYPDSASAMFLGNSEPVETIRYMVSGYLTQNPPKEGEIEFCNLSGRHLSFVDQIFTEDAHAYVNEAYMNINTLLQDYTGTEAYLGRTLLEDISYEASISWMQEHRVPPKERLTILQKVQDGYDKNLPVDIGIEEYNHIVDDLFELIEEIQPVDLDVDVPSILDEDITRYSDDAYGAIEVFLEMSDFKGLERYCLGIYLENEVERYLSKFEEEQTTIYDDRVERDQELEKAFENLMNGVDEDWLNSLKLDNL